MKIGNLADFTRATVFGRIVAGLIAVALTMAGLIAVAAPANAEVVGEPGAGAVVGYDSVYYVNDLRNRATGTVISLPAPPGSATPVQSLTLFDAIQQANARPAGERILITVADQVWVPNQDAANPPKWVTPSNAANPNGSWQTGSAASPLLIKVLQAEDPGFETSVGVENPRATEMLRGANWVTQMGGNTSDFDSTIWGSRYFISHDNVTLDLQQRLGFGLSGDAAPPGSMFAIRGDNVTLRNFASFTSGESGIVISSSSDGTIIENSSLSNPSTPVGGVGSSTYALERAVEIFEGSSNTTIRNTVFDRNYVSAVNLLRSTARGEVSNLTLDGVTWKQTPSASTDLAANYLVATGSTYASNLAGANTSGLRIQNSTISNWCADSAGGNLAVINLEYSTHRNAVISGNTFNGSVNCNLNAIKLYRLGTDSSFDISNNTFTSSVAKSSDFYYSWIYVDDVAAPAATNTTSVKIHDNTISGGNNSALITMDPYPYDRVLSVYRNTMNGIGGNPTVLYENGLHAENPIYSWNVNSQIRTAYPAPAPTVSGCNLTVNVVSPAFYAGLDGTLGTTDTLWVDVYAGDSPTDLDTYVGRIVANAATLQGAGAGGQQYSLPYTGPAGYVRMQTMLSDSNGSNASIGKTSNISRSVQSTGSDTCAPQMWVKQAGWFDQNGSVSTAQSDPTSNRFVNFEIAASELIAAGQLTPADISFAGTAANQQVVSLTQVSATRWQLVAKADGAGTIIPTIAPGAVADPAGNAQTQAANTTVAPVNFAGFTNGIQTVGIEGDQIDDSVTYVSPLVLSKTSATVTEAKTSPVSDTYGVGYFDDSATTGLITDGNQRVLAAPTLPLQICLTNSTDGMTGDASLNPLAPAQTIAAGANVQCATMRTTDTTGNLAVTAIDNFVVDGTRMANDQGAGSASDGSNSPTFRVTSGDPQFDGLVLGPQSGFQTSLTVNDNDRPDATDSLLALTTTGAQANGADLNRVTATVRNDTGDPVSNAPVTFDIPAGVTWVGPDGIPGNADDVVGGAGVTGMVPTNAAGESVLAVTSAVAGAYQISARVNGTEAVQSSPQEVTFVALAVDLDNPATGFTVSTGDQVANGTAEHTITVNLRTVSDTPAAGFETSLAATAAPGSGVVIGAFGETGTPGEYTAVVTSTRSGLKTISVTFDNGSVQTVNLLAGGSATASFVAGPPFVGPGFSGVSIDDTNNRVADGVAFHEITTVLADAQGNPVTGAAARLTSAVAGSPASVTVTSFIESSTVPGTYTALVRSTTSGGKDVTVTFDGSADIGTATANFGAGAVDLGNAGSRYSVSDGDEVVGTGSHTVTVTLADANGNPVAGQSALLSAAPAGSLGSGNITGFTESGPPGVYTATISSTVSGAKVISVRFNGSAVTLDGNDVAAFVAGPVDLNNPGSNFSVSGGEVTVGSGEHAVTVRLADQYGNPVLGEVAELFSTTTDNLGTGSVTVFEDGLVPGSYRALVSSTLSGGKVMTATYNGDPITLLGNDVAVFQPDRVDANAIGTRFTVTTGDEVVGTGKHTITVTLTDTGGNVVPNQADGLEATPLSPLGTGAIGPFIESVTTPGTYTAEVDSSIAGDKAIVINYGADDIQVLATGNDVARFVPGPADLTPGASGFFVSPGSVLVGTGEHDITVRLEDSLGNPIDGRAGDLLATASDLGAGSTTVFSPSGVPGTYVATIQSTLAGGKAVTVTLDGSPVAPDGNSNALFRAGSVDLNAPGSGYSVSGGSVSIVGGSHEITVTLTDQYGNPVTAQSPILGGTSSAPLGSGSVGNFIEGPIGTYTAPVTSTISGDKPIEVTLDNAAVTLNGNGVASFIAGGVDLNNPGTRYSVSGGNQPVGGATHTITVTLADEEGNAVSNEENGLKAFSAQSIGAGVIGDFSESGPPGTYTATISSTVSGPKTITVEFGGGDQVTLGGNGTATFVAGNVDLANAATGFSVSAGQVSVAGGAHQITVTLADQFGNPVSGEELQLFGDAVEALGTGNVSGFVEVVGTPGTYLATVFSSIAGNKTILVDYDTQGLTLRGNGIASFVAGGVDLNNPATGFTVSTGDQVVGTGQHTITVTLADADGNPVLDQELTLDASSTPGIGDGVVSAFSEVGPPGTYTATISSTVSGSKGVVVTYGAPQLSARGNGAAVFVAGDVDYTNPATNYSVSVGSVSVAGGSHTVSVSLADEFGNPVTVVPADIAADTPDPLGTGFVGGFVYSGTPGLYTAPMTSSIAGTKTVTAAYALSALTLSGNGEAIFSAGAVDVGNAATSFLVSSGDEVVGTGSHTITVTLSDAAGNPVGGQAALLEASSAQGLGTGTVSAFDEPGAAGVYTATVDSTLAGGKTIEVLYGRGVVTVDGQAITAGGNDIARFVAGAVDLSNPGTTFSVTTGNQTVVTGSHTVTAILVDSFGNAVSGQQGNLEAVPNGAIGTGVVSNFAVTGTPGTYTATVSSSVAGTKTMEVLFSGNPVAAGANADAVFVAGEPDLSNPGSAYTVSTGSQVVGTGFHTITITLADSSGNPVSGKDALLNASAASSIGGGVITGFVGTGTAGEYTATVSSTISGSNGMLATYDGNSITGTGNTAALFEAGPVDPSNANTLYFVSGGSVLVGTGSHLVTAQLADQYGNPVLGQEGLLNATSPDSLGTGSFTGFQPTSTDGTYEATVRSTNAGAKDVEVDLDGAQISARGGNTVALFAPGSPDPSDPATGFSVSTGSQPVGTGSHTITVTLADDEGNAVSNQQAGLSALIPNIGAGVISAFEESTTIPGTYTATFSSTSAGTKTVSIRFGGDPLTPNGNDTATFTSGGVDPNNAATGFTVSTGNQAVGTGEHTITVTLADQYGNLLDGFEDDLNAASAGGLGAGVIGGFAPSGAAGTYTAPISSTLSGSKLISVNVLVTALTARGNTAAVFVSGPVDLAASQLEATSPARADGVSKSTITLRLFDAFGNPVTQRVTVGFGTTLGTVGSITFNGNGVYTAPLTSKVAGTAKVTASVGSTALEPTANVVFQDVTPPKSPVVDPTNGEVVTGCAEPGSTVTVRDAAGKVIGTGVAGDDCRFSIELRPAQKPGAKISVTATDKDGNVSEPAKVQVGLIWMELASKSLPRGSTQVATGHLFQPGEQVSAVLRSDPIALGSAIADENGDVVFTFQVPEDLELGKHSVTLTGGFSGTISEEFTVVEEPKLSDTGSDVSIPLMVGGILALLGGLLIVGLRRRGTKNSEEPSAS